VEKLGLQNPAPCDWQAAQELTHKYGQTVFISPSVEGWVFIAGALPMEAAWPSAEDPFLAWMREMSTEFGDVRHFSEDNSCPWATWSWCKNGEVVRAYAFRTDPESEVLWNVGPTTEAERDAGYKYGDSGFEGVVSHEDYQKWLPYEEATEVISSAWGVSITELNEEMPCQCSEGVQGIMQVPWAEDGGLEVTETLPVPTPEEEQMALEQMEETVRKYDMVHVLQLYCQSKDIAFPEELRNRNIVDLESYIQAVHDLMQLTMPNVPDMLRPNMASALSGIILKHFKDQLRPRTTC